jgi:hypothetical protein
MFHAWSRLPVPSPAALAVAVAVGLSGCGADLVLPADPVTLTVDGAGSGSGLVATALGPAPALKCSILDGTADAGSCRATYAFGTSVSLSAAPADGSQFTGWGGECSGTAACSISLNDSAHVVARFEVAQFTLVVVGAGTGSGSVHSAVGALPLITCDIIAGVSGDTGCQGDFLLSGRRLTLLADPADGSRFSGWGGDCSGTASCSVLLDRNRVVSAAFVLRRD